MVRFSAVLLGLGIALSGAHVLAAAGPVKVRLWHQLIYAHREVQARLIADFEKQNPDIKIESIYRETEQLRSSFQSAALVGGGPELLQGPSDQVGPLSTMGLLAPMDEYFDAEDLKDFDPLALIKIQGQLLMVGDTVGNHLSLLYNKKLVAKPPTNTDELFQMGRAYKNGYFLVWHMQEPFFFVPWVSGFGEAFATIEGQPRLNTPGMVAAFEFMKKLKASGFVPKDADYETANALFKDGKVAMLVNGDWSWGDYKKAGIDFGIARLPMISETGQWPSPLVAAKGWSVNKNVAPEKKDALRRVLKFLTSSATQLAFTKQVSTLPSRLSARQNEIVSSDELLKSSAAIMQVGTPMPVTAELRAVWDALRIQYQAVLGGSVEPKVAAERAQLEADHQIKVMNEIRPANAGAWVVKILMALAAIGGTGYLLRQVPSFLRDLRGPNKMAYAFLIPAMLCVALVVVFPFFYNIAISFSNLSLRTFADWEIIGFQNYFDVIVDPVFYSVFLKTVAWTFLNLLFHVGLGIMLALLIDQTLPAKPLWRTLLIIPWAVPQYITALTWRGMFNQEFGAINQVLGQFFATSPIEWLSKPFEMFAACLITNIWLGFPFMMMVALGGLQGIPRELYEAARVDGANAWQRFWRITWPLLQPVMVPATVLGAIWTFNNLNVVWLVSNGGEPAGQTHILVSYVYKSAFDLYRYSASAALSMVIFLILLGTTLFYLKISDKKIGVSG
jgi:arabinogalactan oligomer/maltooligosaccharide transport system permease protein